MAQDALITGVGHRGGIGYAIAEALAARGDRVFVTRFGAFDAARPWSAGATDVPWPSIDVDLADPDGPRAVFDAADRAGLHIDILINNHAYFRADSLEMLSAEQLDRHLAVNVRATLLLCREFVARHSGGWGRIVNLTSGQTVHPMPEELSYAVSKSAIEGATLSLSAAVASRGITVNAVDPGGTDTGWMPDEQRAREAAQSPRGRLGTPQDAANLIAFLTSDEGGWVTGQIIRSRGWVG